MKILDAVEHRTMNETSVFVYREQTDLQICGVVSIWEYDQCYHAEIHLAVYDSNKKGGTRIRFDRLPRESHKVPLYSGDNRATPTC
jgi:hypothetical protein